jgi:LysR family glycine cleavage system transcriptional activator
LFEESILPLASPVFIERHRLREPGELLQVPLIQSTVSLIQWNDWLTSRGLSQHPERFALRFDRASLSLDAAVQGLGVALESTTMAKVHLDADRLRPLFDPTWSVPVRAHFLVYPPRHAERPAVAQFVEWLSAEAGHY